MNVSTRWTQSATASATALITPMRTSVVRYVLISLPSCSAGLLIFFFKQLKVELISSLSFRLDYRGVRLSCALGYLLEKSPRPWLLYLFHSSLKAALVISEVFVFSSIWASGCVCIFFSFFDQLICQRALLGFQRVIVAFSAKAGIMTASSQLNLIFWSFTLVSPSVFCAHPPMALLCPYILFS